MLVIAIGTLQVFRFTERLTKDLAQLKSQKPYDGSSNEKIPSLLCASLKCDLRESRFILVHIKVNCPSVRKALSLLCLYTSTLIAKTCVSLVFN